MSRFGLEEFMESDLDSPIENEVTNVDLSDDEIADNEITLSEQQEENAFVANDLIESLESLETIYTRKSQLIAQEEISLEEFNQFKQEVATSLAKYDLSVEQVFPSLENVSDIRVALERTDEQMTGTIQKLGQKMSSYLKSSVDTAQFILTFYNGQQRRINTMINELKSFDKNAKLTISTKATMHLRVNEKGEVVKDGKQYVTLTKESLTLLQGLVSSVDRFVSGDFLNSIKTLFLFLSNKHYSKQFIRLETLINDISKLPGVKTGKGEEAGSTAFESKTFIGMYRLLGIFPNKDIYDNNADSRADVASMFSIRLQRFEKFRVNGEIVTLNLTVGDILELLELASELNRQLLRYNRAATKLSSIGANYVQVDFVKNILPLPGFWIVFLLKNYRLMVKLSYTVAYLSGATYNISKGQVNKIVELSKKAVQQS